MLNPATALLSKYIIKNERINDMQNIIYFTPKHLTEEHFELISACNGNGTLNEITPDGNLDTYIIAPYISPQEVQILHSCTPATYFYEKGNNSAILINLKAFVNELIVNPSYYTDDRWNKFKDGTNKNLTIYLIDSAKNVIVAAKVFSLQGNTLRKIRTSLEQNSKSSRNELDFWTLTNLYTHNANENIKRSSYIGKCYENPNIEVILV